MGRWVRRDEHVRLGVEAGRLNRVVQAVPHPRLLELIAIEVVARPEMVDALCQLRNALVAYQQSSPADRS